MSDMVKDPHADELAVALDALIRDHYDKYASYYGDKNVGGWVLIVGETEFGNDDDENTNIISAPGQNGFMTDGIFLSASRALAE